MGFQFPKGISKGSSLKASTNHISCLPSTSPIPAASQNSNAPDELWLFLVPAPVLGFAQCPCVPALGLISALHHVDGRNMGALRSKQALLHLQKQAHTGHLLQAGPQVSHPLACLLQPHGRGVQGDRDGSQGDIKEGTAGKVPPVWSEPCHPAPSSGMSNVEQDVGRVWCLAGCLGHCAPARSCLPEQCPCRAWQGGRLQGLG